MAYVIKAAVQDPRAATFKFSAQKTMYGGKHITVGDEVFIFSSENQGGLGLVARGTVIAVATVPRRHDVARQTPRVSVIIRSEALAKRQLGRSALKSFRRWDDGTPETELNFKLYRQATNKIVGISAGTESYLGTFF